MKVPFEVWGFGLMGMISTFGMLNRTAELHIHAQADLEKILQPQLNYFCTDLSFNIIFHTIHPRKHELIFEDRSIQVFSIPLKHRGSMLWIPVRGKATRQTYHQGND